MKKETRLSLADWILSIRLLVAVNDLTNGETVEETAWNAGYENPSAFIRRFRRQFGMTPGQFRNEQMPKRGALTTDRRRGQNRFVKKLGFNQGIRNCRMLQCRRIAVAKFGE